MGCYAKLVPLTFRPSAVNSVGSLRARVVLPGRLLVAPGHQNEAPPLASAGRSSQSRFVLGRHKLLTPPRHDPKVVRGQLHG